MNARAKLNKQKPYMFVGSPACTALSAWMAPNVSKSKDVAAIRHAKVRAVRHMDFVIGLYYGQLLVAGISWASTLSR